MIRIARPSKYHNKKTYLAGTKFDSKKEARRHSELILLEKAGKIKNLRRQVKYLIAESVTWNGKKLRDRYLIVDHDYEEENQHIAEDSKGMATDLYKLKRQLFLSRYPDIVFRES